MFKAGILDHKGRGLKLHLDKMKAEESRTKLVKPERFEGKFVWECHLGGGDLATKRRGQAFIKNYCKVQTDVWDMW